MKIINVSSTFIQSKIDHGKIHGQGSAKNYCFLLVETDRGNFFSEVYSGTYSWRLVEACVSLINEKVCLDHEYSSIEDLRASLHTPFISGNGFYESCVSAVVNAVHSYFPKHQLKKSSNVLYYYSGGTVKSTLSDLAFEADVAEQNGYSFYKVRLDYRDIDDCKSKIRLLNDINLPYCVDFIVNTNFNTDASKFILPLTSMMDTSKVIWVEEPFVPSTLYEQQSFVEKLRFQGHKIALGESFTSLFELQALSRSGFSDFVQLDSTITSDVSSLILFAEATERKVAFHNWGSMATSLQNMIVAAKIDKTSYFEVPYYLTPFDRWLSSIKTLCSTDVDYTVNEREEIFKGINSNGTQTKSDFLWS